MATRFGVGFRTQHFDAIRAAPRAVDWLEVLSDDHLTSGGPRRKRLLRLRADHEIALHGVGLGIAGSDPLDERYLDALVALARGVEPAFVSDHLCWTAFRGHQSHDLLPVAYNEEVLDHVAARVDAVQERLGRQLLLENASAYVAFRGDTLGEAEFLAALCRRTGCGLLLDVNNLFVNAANLGVDPLPWLAALPADAVGYLHLAGHAVLADVRVDTHDADVPAEVWSLFEVVARRWPDAPVILERDDRIPPFEALVAELDVARRLHARAQARADRVTREPSRAASCQQGLSPVTTWQKEFFERVVDKPVGFEHAGAEALLDDARPVRAARGLRVYSDAYAAHLRDALATNLPALARVLRRDDFDALAAAYLRAHPPRGHGFETLGAALADFVRTHVFATDYGVGAQALADLAALEQAQLEVQHAPDAGAALGPEALADVPPEDWALARFELAPAQRVVFATHDVLPCVEAVARGAEPARPAAGAVAYWVQRLEDRVRTEPIALDVARVLASLAAGAPFGEASRGDAELGARSLVLAAARGLVVRRLGA
jgi:uncharacterized protein (UPF0276 family)